ncbi:hypothetical protein CUMW_079860 [Citrus unshiu]|uniref:Stress-associated endoplasmic reticulum protein n=2 Tax=Citrus TaxID=2706 RepID=A0A067GQ65_CITSI|nr:hypothetical protein CISIN_1g032965mg [Citrus sinensis]GAY44129.1 hypothetical protein CUMW_079860 [Citrus unshiu]
MRLQSDVIRSGGFVLFIKISFLIMSNIARYCILVIVSQLNLRKSSLCLLMLSLIMMLDAQTTSKRLAVRKVDKFEKNIMKRGAVPETTTKKGKDYPVGPVLLGFFVFVVIGSSLFQIIRTATSGGMA